jgi:hypothetical protein
MRRHRIQGLRLRRRVQTTIADPAAAKAPDLIGRDFTAAAVNQRYVGDITIYRSANADSFTWQRLLTCTHAAWRAGRSPITCAPTWSSTPSRRPSGLGAASTELSSIPIMEPNTHRTISLPPARLPGSASRCPPSVVPPTTPSRSRSTPASNARPCKAAVRSPTNARPAWPASADCTATTPSAATPGSDSNPRSTTRTASKPRQLRWRQPHKPRVQDPGSSSVEPGAHAFLWLGQGSWRRLGVEVDGSVHLG